MRKKVLYVFGGELASGAEIVIERLMTYNIKNVEAHLFISPGLFADRLLVAGKPYPITLVPQLKKLNRSSSDKVVFYAKALSNYFSVSRLVLNYVRKHKITIIHANTVVPASYLIPAISFSRLKGSKKFWMWSDHDIKHYAKLDHYFSDLCSRLFNRTLVVSNAVRKKYPGRASVEVLYNGLDPDFFRPSSESREEFRKEQGLPGSSVVLGIAGTISPRKGQLELVRIFEELRVDYSDIILLVVGGLGPDDENYNQQFLNYVQGKQQVKYLSHYSNMPIFYNGCDIIINNSTNEGSEPLGTTIYEAMACEKIVIASNTGGTTEIVTHGVNGFTFEASNSEALKGAIKAVIGEMDNLELISTAARKQVLSKFSLQKMADHYNQVININNSSFASFE